MVFISKCVHEYNMKVIIFCGENNHEICSKNMRFDKSKYCFKGFLKILIQNHLRKIFQNFYSKL